VGAKILDRISAGLELAILVAARPIRSSQTRVSTDETEPLAPSTAPAKHDGPVFSRSITQIALSSVFSLNVWFGLLFAAALLLDVRIARVKVHGIPVNLVVILFGLIAVRWLVLGFARGIRLISGSVMNLPIALFVGISFAASVLGLLQGHASNYEAAQSFYPFVLYLLFFPLANSMMTRRQVIILMALLFAITEVAFIRDLLFAFSGVDFITHIPANTWLRLGSLYRVVTPSAPYAGLILVLALSLFIHVHDALVRSLLLVSAASAGSVLLLTATRGLWAGVLFAIPIVLVLSFGRAFRKISARQVIATGVVVLVFASAGAWLIAERGSDLLANPLAQRVTTAIGDLSVSDRLAETQAAIFAWETSPVIGLGLGGHVRTVWRTPAHANDPSGSRGYITTVRDTSYVHNMYIYLLAEVGLLGLAAFLILIITFTRHCWQALSLVGAKPERGLLVGFLACLAVLLVASLSSPDLKEQTLIPFVALMMGVTYLVQAEGYRATAR
jgi:putative inorganic carbon (HCO3(-)) transporter